MLEQLDENSVVVCTRMSRLSRSLSDMFSVMETIRSKGADVIFLHENIDTTTSQGRLVFGLMNVINSYSRELIAHACKEGRDAAEEKEGFDRWGRPDKFTPEQKQHVRDLRKQNKSYNDIVKLTGISRASVYLIMALLALYLLNSYGYYGEQMFWKTVNESGKRLLKPLRILPVEMGKIDLAPFIAFILAFGLSFALRREHLANWLGAAN